MRASSDMTCASVGVHLAEYAAGLLSGDERDRVASHVDECALCWDDAERFASVLDALVELAPDAEPPDGFEDALWDRIGARPGRSALAPVGVEHLLDSRLRRRRRSLAGVAALVVLALSFAIGLVVGGGSRAPAPRRAVANLTAAFESNGRRVGTVSVVAGPPAWLYVTMSPPSGFTGEVTCTVTLSDGRTESLGRFRLLHGRGSWGVPLPGTARLRAARLVAGDRTVVASARLWT